jgi:tRNA dimethylallyltransferase
VYKITGEPLSHQQMQFDEGVSADRCKVFVLGWSRGALHARIDARVDWMFSAGLIPEVHDLLERFGAMGRTASQAVGYREALAYLRSEISLPETERRVKVRTHQFARRQETWFRSLSECRRITMDGAENPVEVAGRLFELGQAVGS